VSFRWVIITGAYPPEQGGLADYTAVLAKELASQGDQVTVVTGPLDLNQLPILAGVEVLTLSDHFGRRGLAQLDQYLATLQKPYRLLVQYVPQALGPRRTSRFKGLPLTFAWWLRRSHAASIWTMFHEAKVLAPPGSGLALQALACLTDQMLGWTARASERIFVAMPAWEPHIAQHLRSHQRVEYLPIPSNVATVVDLAATARTRALLLNGHARAVVGHFGTFSSELTDLMEPLLRRTLAEHPERQILLVGDGSREFAASLESAVSGRITATGRLAAESVAEHLSACDLMLQPFPDGASTRRGSIMAGLALGVPVVSNRGCASEPLWREHQAIGLADDTESLPALVDQLLSSPDARQALGARGRTLYERHFSLAHTLRILRN